jgi:diguanylate cyclase (GGDEF)-like protein
LVGGLYDHNYREELNQSYTRYIYLIALLPLIISIDFSDFEKSTSINVFYILFSVVAWFHHLILVEFPGLFVNARKYAIILIDIFGTTFMIYQLGKYGFIFDLLYLWIIIGNGLRFGQKYLYYSMFLTIASILFLYIKSEYWHTHVDLILYMIVTSIVLPLFTLVLIKRLQRKNEELKELLEILDKQSKIDPLTGVNNRLYFELELKRLMDGNIPFALLFTDLDNFKDVNDLYGHDQGDEILKEVARRLGRFVDGDSFLARLGGDEFVIVTRKDGDELEKMAGLIVEALSRPYETATGVKIENLSASIGISRYPHDTRDPFMLKKYADQAMYKVKRSGKNGYLYHKRTHHRRGGKEILEIPAHRGSER